MAECGPRFCGAPQGRCTAPGESSVVAPGPGASRCRAAANSVGIAGATDLETSLYLPVKRFLEGLGFTVKGEIGGCDLLALREGGAPLVVIGELKVRFNLELILQAVDRAAAADEVWVAARVSAKGGGREADARYRNLCRRLGFGMLAVSDAGGVEVIVSPAAPLPRRDPKRRSRLVAGAQAAAGRPRRRRQHAAADHDGVPAAGAGLRGGARGWAQAAARPEGRRADGGADSPR